MKTFLPILFSVFGVNQLTAQNIKILSATEQSWSGGQCCNHGIDYVIKIESNDTIQLLKFDSVWIGNYAYVKGKSQNLRITHYKWNGKIYYTAIASQSWSGREDDEIDNVLEIKQVKENANSPKYKGVACIIASTSNSKHYLEVKSFQLLPPTPYP